MGPYFRDARLKEALNLLYRYGTALPMQFSDVLRSLERALAGTISAISVNGCATRYCAFFPTRPFCSVPAQFRKIPSLRLKMALRARG
jgi:hypothetical protein